MPRHKQARPNPENNFVSIGQAGTMLGWNPQTVRRNIERFEAFGPRSISKTPGGHIRILRDAVLFVLGQQTPSTKAEDICRKLASSL